MNYIGKFISNFREFYNEINSATLTGAIDVVVVRQPDGTYLCSPFHVRFGKIGVLRSREKVVDIEVNGEPIDIHMKLGDSGEAFFVQEVEDEDDVVPVHLATSPLPPVPDIEEELRKMKASNRITDTKTFTETSEHHLLEVRTLEDGTQDLCHSSVNVRNSVIETSVDCEVLVQSIHSERVVCNGSLSSSPKSSFLELPKFENVCKVIKEEVSVGIQTEESKETSVPEECVVNISTALNNESHTDSQDDLKQKKKRKKKTSAKKRTKSKEISIPASRIDSDFRGVPPGDQDIHSILKNSDDDVADEQEDIFQMDDDYDVDEGYPSLLNGLSRSVSLPVNSKIFSSYEWPVRKMSATFTGEFHPFSDGDVTPHSSPSGSRPPSPKSDTEYEIQKHDAMSQTDTREPSWGWGQLPNVPKQLNSIKTPNRQQTDISSHIDVDKVQDNADEEKRSMLGGIIGFMRSTKKLRHMPESEGIYLDDINPDDLNPQVAALYFPKFKSSYHPQTDIKSPIQDEDAESGNGPSLPHSPHSVVGAIGGPHSIDSDTDDRMSCFDYYSDLAMSLCGGLQDIEAELPEDRFLHSIVTYDEFTENPAILQNPNLVIRMNGKYYNWSTAAPVLLSIMMFQRPLPEKTTNQLIDEHMPKKKKSKSYSSWWYWRRIPPESDVKKSESELSPPTQTALPASQSSENSMSPSPEKVFPLTPDKNAAVNQHNVPLSLETSLSDSLRKNASLVEDVNTSMNIGDTALEIVSVEPSSIADSPTTRAEVTLSLPSNESSNVFSSQAKLEFEFEGLKHEKQISKHGEVVSPSTDYKHESIRLEEKIPRHPEKFKKSLRLSSDQIASLNLRKGPNEVVFSVTTAYQGTTRCKCHIYLWDCNDKIVISDIDGTITKSDVLGHILPIIGKDWAQMGVAKLFTTVKENGYQFLYLSARAIGQARITRDYLRSVRQGDLCLPDGPLLLSPTSLINALHREVIEKKPEEFKISCLRDIQALYPYSVGNPFYAGFGNKINDTFAYRAVGIPTSRIFTINHRGELKSELIQTFQSSYTRLSDVVDLMFPPMGHRNIVNGHLAASFTASEEFSYFTYWRDPLPVVKEDDDLLVQR